MSDFNLESGDRTHRVALVTGATGNLGRRLALRLAGEGWSVCATGRRSDALSSLVGALPTPGGASHHAIPADLARSGTGGAVARDAIDKAGRITHVIHLACPPIVNEERVFDPAVLAPMIRVNQTAFLEIVDVLLPELLRAQDGCLMGVLTEAMKPPVVASWPSYVQAKTALMGSLAVLAQRCRGTGVRAIGFAPGALDFEDTALPAGVTREKQLRLDPDTCVDAMFTDLSDEKSLRNGGYRIVSRLGRDQGMLAGLPVPPPPAPAAAPITPVATNGAVANAPAAGADAESTARLAATFCRVFNLDPDTDVASATVHNVAAWDSIGQLRLIMEVEQAMEVTLPSDRVGGIASYRELLSVVSERL